MQTMMLQALKRKTHSDSPEEEEQKCPTIVKQHCHDQLLSYKRPTDRPAV